MKTKTIVALTLLVLLGAFSACVPSLNPLYTEKDLIFEQALVGNWLEGEDGSTAWTFTRETNKTYRVVIKDSDKPAGEFRGHLMQLGKHRFLDLYPDTSAMQELKRDDYYKSHYVPVHTFYHVQQIEPTLQMASLDLDWLRDYLKKNPKAIAHTRLHEGDSDDGRICLTAPTAALQAFMRKMVTTKGAFADPSEMKKK